MASPAELGGLFGGRLASPLARPSPLEMPPAPPPQAPGPHTAFSDMFNAWDAPIREASRTAVDSGLVWMGDMMAPVLVIITMTVAALMWSGQISGAYVQKYGGRALLLMWLVFEGAYIPVLADMFTDAIPKEIAGAIHGMPQGEDAFARQFDAVAGMFAGMKATLLGQHTGPLQVAERTMLHAVHGAAKAALWVLFGCWILVRTSAFLGVVVLTYCLVFLPFDSTRPIFMGQINRLVGLMMWQLCMSVVLWMSLDIMQDRMNTLAETPIPEKGTAMDAVIDLATQLWFFVLMAACIPAAVGKASGFMATVGAASGIGGMAIGFGRNVAGGIAGVTNRTVARLHAATQVKPSRPPGGQGR